MKPNPEELFGLRKSELDAALRRSLWKHCDSPGTDILRNAVDLGGIGPAWDAFVAAAWSNLRGAQPAEIPSRLRTAVSAVGWGSAGGNDLRYIFSTFTEADWAGFGLFLVIRAIDAKSAGEPV